MLMVTDGGEEKESEPLPDLLFHTAKDGSVEGVVFSPTLAEQQQRNCCKLLGQFVGLFSPTPGLTHCCVLGIDTGDSLHVKNKTYRLSKKGRASIQEEVSKMLSLGMIEPSSSPSGAGTQSQPKRGDPRTKVPRRLQRT